MTVKKSFNALLFLLNLVILIIYALTFFGRIFDVEALISVESPLHNFFFALAYSGMFWPFQLILAALLILEATLYRKQKAFLMISLLSILFVILYNGLDFI